MYYKYTHIHIHTDRAWSWSWIAHVRKMVWKRMSSGLLVWINEQKLVPCMRMLGESEVWQLKGRRRLFVHYWIYWIQGDFESSMELDIQVQVSKEGSRLMNSLISSHTHLKPAHMAYSESPPSLLQAFINFISLCMLPQQFGYSVSLIFITLEYC